MKLVVLIGVFLFGLSSVAAPQVQKIINVDNEIKLIQEKTIAGKGKFKVIEVSNNSVFKDLGYKKGYSYVKTVINGIIYIEYVE